MPVRAPFLCRRLVDSERASGMVGSLACALTVGNPPVWSPPFYSIE